MLSKMRRMYRPLNWIVVAVLVAASLLMGVQALQMDDSAFAHDGHDMDMGTPTATADSDQAAWPVKVDVELVEFTITMSVTDFVVGQPYYFVVTNMGHIPHQMSLHPDMGDMDMGGMDMSDNHGDGALIEIALDPLTTWSGMVTFAEPGAYMAMCHVPGHEAMMVMVNVKAAG